jgi:CheY-like chemotaxis protein
LLLQVKDTGIGISAEEQKRLFQPFVQINNALNRQQTGTGLGLALVKQIVDLHQGNVGVESALGQGSCFTVSLPLRFQGMTSLQPSFDCTKVLPFPSSACVTEAYSPLVLLAQMNSDNRQTLLTYLSARRYRVITIEDDKGAIALAENHKPDVIVMDIPTPGSHDLEVAHLIRTHPTLSHVPIVAMTPRTVPIDQALYREVGLTHFLTKPFRLKELTFVIDRLLDPLAEIRESAQYQKQVN